MLTSPVPRDDTDLPGWLRNPAVPVMPADPQPYYTWVQRAWTWPFKPGGLAFRALRDLGRIEIAVLGTVVPVLWGLAVFTSLVPPLLAQGALVVLVALIAGECVNTALFPPACRCQNRTNPEETPRV